MPKTIDSYNSSSEDTMSYSDLEAQKRCLETGASFNFKALQKSEYRIQLSFKDINFSVPTKDGGEKTILSGVSGIAEPGQFLAIMGPSGAGKTSLLSLLAGRLSESKGRVSGDVRVNGRHMDSATFRKYTAYVLQHDILFESMTVREAFIFSAKLRLPKSLSDSQINRRVDTVIESLMLSEVQHSLIGGRNIRGVSGGERKRVSIGVELVTNPGLLFVDEPTSGLDSVTAERIVELLAGLAATGRTVVCTIHQPNSDLWNLFDQVCFMTGGRVAYLGGRHKAVERFTALGFPCPQLTNPADFFLKILFPETKAEIQRIEELSEEQRMATLLCIKEKELNEGNLEPLEASPIQRVGFSTQMMLLAMRTLKNMYRQPLTSRIRVIQSVVVGLIAGVIFYKVGDEDDSASIGSEFQNIIGGMFMIFLNFLVTTTVSVVLTFPSEKDLFKREIANDMYSTLTYFLAKIIIELPFYIMFAAVTLGIAYPMMDLRPGFVPWVSMLVAGVSVQVNCYGMGLLVGIAVSNPESAVSLAPNMLMPNVLFSGLLINVDSMAVWYRWISNICFMYYAFDSVVQNQFENANPDFQKALVARGFNSNLSQWENIAISYAFGGFMLFLGWAMLQYRSAHHTVSGTLKQSFGKNSSVDLELERKGKVKGRGIGSFSAENNL
eukprot:176430_1